MVRNQRRTKRLGAFLTALALMLSLLPAEVFADDDWGADYAYVDGLLTITGNYFEPSIFAERSAQAANVTRVKLEAGVNQRTGAGTPMLVNQFAGFSSLASFEVDNDNPVYLASDGVLFARLANDTGHLVLICYPPQRAGDSYVIPSNVTRVAGGAFHNQSGLTVYAADPNQIDTDSGWTSNVGAVSSYTVAVTGLSLNKYDLELTAGGSETLTATVAPADATVSEVLWSSEDASVATVDKNGLVTAVDAGTTYVCATSVGLNGSGAHETARCKVVVTANTPTMTIPDHEGEDTLALAFDVKPGEGGDQTLSVSYITQGDRDIVWTSADPDVALLCAGSAVTAAVPTGLNGALVLASRLYADALGSESVTVAANESTGLSTVTVVPVKAGVAT